MSVRKTTAISIAAIIILGSAGFAYWFFGLKGVTYRLESDMVEPGGALVLLKQYRRTWGDSSDLGQYLKVLDENGRNIAYTTNTFFEAVNLARPADSDSAEQKIVVGRALAAALETAPGFLLGQEPNANLVDYAANLESGRGYFLLEDIGCPVGLGEPTGLPPRVRIETITVEVLPGTPAGQYTLVVPADYPCATPSDEVRLPFEVGILE